MALLNVKVANIEQEAEDIRSFLLAKTGLFRLPGYQPGAHIHVHCGEGLVRQYSLCGDPNDRNHYQIAVKKIDPSRGGSALMHDTVSTGDRLEISTPQNRFSLDKDATHSILIAGGIGITPLIAMADRLHAQQQSFELHYFCRTVKQIAFRHRLLNTSYSSQVFFYTGLNASDTSDQLKEILANPTVGGRVYLCGPTPFTDAAQSIAYLKWSEDSIKLERFLTKPALAGAPTKDFTVVLAKTGLSLKVKADQTILEVLEENDIYVAYSCEQGICGTCVTDIIEGSPEHRDSFLSEKQRAQGKKICLCVSRTVENQITLDL